VGESRHRWVQRVDRADVDDLAAASLRDHLLRGRLHRVEHAQEVHLQHALEQLGVDLQEWRERVDARVVDEDVQAAEAVDGGGDHRVGVLPAADVRPLDQGTAGAASVQSLGDGAAGLDIEVCDQNGGARLVEAFGDAASDAHRAAGHDRDLAGEVDQIGDGWLGEDGWCAHGPKLPLSGRARLRETPSDHWGISTLARRAGIDILGSPWGGV
jgi:hypothetical protein